MRSRPWGSLAGNLHDLLDIRVHRVSQGSGVFMLTDAELDEVSALGCSASVEVSLFARPNAGWDTSATSVTPAGGALAALAALRGGGELPSDMQAKMSVMLPIANPATARVLERLGASTLNVTPDLSL